MKIRLLFILFGLGLAGCGESEAERPADWQGPIAAATRTRHDFGPTFAGARDQVEFVIENRGGRVLQILRTREDCGCTKPSFDRQSIPPGEQARMTVMFEAPVIHGPLRKKIRVFTNDRFAEILEFELAMEGLGHAALSEAAFDLEDEVITGEVRRRIAVRLPEGYRLEGIQGRFEAPFVELVVASPSESAFDLVIRRPWQRLLLRDYLDFNLVTRTPTGETKLLRPQCIQLTGSIQPAVAFDPPRVDFGWVAGDEHVTRTVELRGLDPKGGRFELDEMIEVEAMAGSAGFRLRLRSGEPGALRRLLRFVDPEGRSYPLPVFAYRSPAR